MDTAGARPILCFATQGHEHIEGHRIRAMLEHLSPESYRFERSHKLRSALGLVSTARRLRPRLIVMEGTGVAGGATLMLIDALLGIPYVVSSGDAVGPYLGLRSRVIGFLGGRYERLLCRRCAGFIGWTPYLVGRAMAFGAPRAMTAPGWTRDTAAPGARAEVRRRLGIPDGSLVIGLTGSIHRRRGYVYGAELIDAVRATSRSDLAVLIIGGGSGLEQLREMAGQDLGRRVFLPGRVAPAEVPDLLAACDLASLSQSVDQVGAFRYTTKLSEYLAAGLPVITGQTPLSYDLDEGYLWRLPGAAPWSPDYGEALSHLLGSLGAEEVAERAAAVGSRAWDPFDKADQQRRAHAFISDLLAARA